MSKEKKERVLISVSPSIIQSAKKKLKKKRGKSKSREFTLSHQVEEFLKGLA